MEDCRPSEVATGGEDAIEEEEPEEVLRRDTAGTDGREEAVADVTGKTWEVSLLDRPPSDGGAEDLYVYRNVFHLLPRTIGRLGHLKTLKFFANEIEVLPPEAGDLVDLERLQIKVSSPGISGIPLRKLRSLTELELCRVPPRLSAFSMLTDISGLKCLTKLAICHFSIRYLPPEIGNLTKLEELDISFNKLKNLPNDIVELSSLRLLKVANNKLVDLPPGISFLRSLETLDLSNNKLTSVVSLNLSSMSTLQCLNIQYNKLRGPCQIPSWISCNFEGNMENNSKDDAPKSLVMVDVHSASGYRNQLNRSCNGCRNASLCSHHEVMGFKCHATKRMKRNGWKRRSHIQQRIRQERLSYSRKWKGEGKYEYMTVKMVEESCAAQAAAEKDKLQDKSTIEITNLGGISVQNNGCLLTDVKLRIDGSSDNKRIGLHKESCADHGSCITSESTSLDRENAFQVANEDCYLFNAVSTSDVSDEGSSTELYKSISNSKRHSDKDLDSPKPRKFQKPVDDFSDVSCKYSIRSFCSTDDHLPDGFYDAGRDRPFMSLNDYEQNLHLDSREVILLDREKDEELDAIVFSAQLLMSNLKSSSLSGMEDGVVDNLHRASILALFVSDCFGGSERSTSIMKTRRAILGLRKQQPFVCTCSAGDINDKNKTSAGLQSKTGDLNFNDLCEKSLQLIKETHNSNVVPIGTLRFGVCRHRAVLMKYLCDRVNPPIPCELVRGYLDFMPHAWNAIFVRRGNSWQRMVVDACYPTDIREEKDVEYYCRYIPLSYLNTPLLTKKDSGIPRCIWPSTSYEEFEHKSSNSVIHSRFGSVDVSLKVRNLETSVASDIETREFEYRFLGEVRLLRALRNHSCIVDIYAHQLSTKWIQGTDKIKGHKLLKSIIVMEYVKGGSVRDYIDKLSENGEKHVPVDMAFFIAKDVACALEEVHSKQIIHRDIKSENVLIDLDSQRSDGRPIVKLCDFDRSVPLHSITHTCCIAHRGVHPPDVCVGTPRWMAPEVVQAMHQKNPYGLEVDIWSYGCLLFELLTLQVPFHGQSEHDIYELLQMKQRPRLTPELERLASLGGSEHGRFNSADAEILRLLIDLFYKCTRGNPVDRPSASHIYDNLCAVSPKLNTTCDAKK